MKNIFIHLPLIVLVILFSWSCSKESNPLIEENITVKLDLKTEKSQYRLEEISNGNYIYIKATLLNTSLDTFYTKLGDTFNSSFDQEDLLIAKYTDGYIEKNISNSKWASINLSSLFEGSKIIRILPSKKYNLTASAYLDSSIEGKFRLKVYYYNNYSPTKVDTLKDVSNVFTISKN